MIIDHYAEYYTFLYLLRQMANIVCTIILECNIIIFVIIWSLRGYTWFSLINKHLIIVSPNDYFKTRTLKKRFCLSISIQLNNSAFLRTYTNINISTTHTQNTPLHIRTLCVVFINKQVLQKKSHSLKIFYYSYFFVSFYKVSWSLKLNLKFWLAH